jgi:hypothetical protein
MVGLVIFRHPGFDPGVHFAATPWIAGSSPAMTYRENKYEVPKTADRKASAAM